MSAFARTMLLVLPFELRRDSLRRWLAYPAFAVSRKMACPAVAQEHKVVIALLSEGWWRRGESNPRPKILYSGPLRAFPVVWVSSPGTPAGRVPFGPSREKARLRPPGRRLQAIP